MFSTAPGTLRRHSDYCECHPALIHLGSVRRVRAAMTVEWDTCQTLLISYFRSLWVVVFLPNTIKTCNNWQEGSVCCNGKTFDSDIRINLPPRTLEHITLMYISNNGCAELSYTIIVMVTWRILVHVVDIFDIQCAWTGIFIHLRYSGERFLSS